MQAWHQDSIQCHMLDFRGKGELQRKENFIEWIKGSTLLRSSLINRNNVRTPIQFRKRKAIPESWNIFLSRADLSVFISITPVIWMVKWSKLSIPSIEINKPLPPDCLICQISDMLNISHGSASRSEANYHCCHIWEIFTYLD